MRLNRKPFRIEGYSNASLAPQTSGPGAAQSMADFAANGQAALIIAEIRALKTLVAAGVKANGAEHPEISPQDITRQVLDTFKSELAEAGKMKAELDAINNAIDETKHEIASVHISGFQGKEMKRVTGELDAIISGTADATDNILSAAEEIDQMVSELSARQKTQQDHAICDDISARVITIFENCNFQDLTGQRITKVVSTLKFIEERIARMMEIWGGLESFQSIEVEHIAEATGDQALLNGPKLNTDAGHASQDDIDALFS